MSVVTDSNIETVYVSLLDEGTFVLRPVKATMIKKDIYKLEEVSDYDSEVERWEFPPGSIVKCSKKNYNSEEIMLAYKVFD